MLVRRGWAVNLKRVRRLWNDLGLRRPVRLRKLRKLGPKPGASAQSCVRQPARFKNDVWTCDFVHDDDQTIARPGAMPMRDQDVAQPVQSHPAVFADKATFS
jgi:putative transposase